MNNIMNEYLTYFETEKNSNKFYSACCNKDNDNYIVTYNWGRVGERGSSKEMIYKTLEEAQKELTKKVNSKVKKGYLRKKPITIKASSNESNLDSTIADFVNKIYNCAKSSIIKYSGDLNLVMNLGKEGIESGREVLQKIANASTLEEKENLSKEYWKIIPRNMGRKIQYNDWFISEKKISKEVEILDLYADAINTMIDNAEIQTMYENMHCDLKVCSSEEMSYIKNKINSSKASNHKFSIKVINAFKINQKNAPAFTDCGNVVNLFHGTRAENVLGILSSNLKLPNTLNNVYKTGAMFGPGLYFANNSTKSANYCFGFNGRNTKAYMFICEVALGNVYETYTSNYFKNAPHGYNSVKGCKGRQLINNEFIVYNENQVRIKYIVEIERI